MQAPISRPSSDSRVLSIAPWIGDEDCRQAVGTFAARLSESERRWLGGMLAMLIGHGGIGAAAGLVGLCPETVSRGKRELAKGLEHCPRGRDRAAGAGRPAVEAKCPEIEDVLTELMEPHIYGDPASGRKYCRRSTRALARDLTARGFPVGRDTVRRLLKKKSIRCAPTSSASPARRTPTATANSK